MRDNRLVLSLVVTSTALSKIIKGVRVKKSESFVPTEVYNVAVKI